MLNRNVFRERPELVRRMLELRGRADRVGEVERMVELDASVRSETAAVDELRRRVKESSREVGRAVQEAREAGQDAGAAAEEARERSKRLGDELKSKEAELKELEAERDALELGFPNLLDERVPEGAGEEDNVVLRRWGDAPEIANPVAHDVLGERLGILDFKRAAKVAGARFAFLVGAGARLEHALIRFMRDVHAQAGDLELLPPLLVNEAAATATGQLPKFADDLFRVTAEPGYYLIPTAEVPLTNYLADEILEGEDLPTRWFAWSPCFRSEAGSYGKDVRGYIRQHHFNKVEMVRVCTPEQAHGELEAMTARAEGILQALGLHHRVVTLCSADTGNAAALTHDLEVWLPSQEAFREISSCSTCGDFQARRARIRYRATPGAKPETCHTLNGSGLAVGRTLVAILEQCQSSDGSVRVPEVLVPYFGASEITAP